MEGRYIRLRPIQKGDLNWICQWWKDPELMKYYNRLPISNRFHVEAEFRDNQRTNNRRDFIIIRNEDTPLGLAYLSNINWRNRNCQVHVMLAEKTSNITLFCGVEAALLLLCYAFLELNMHRVESQTIEYANTALKSLKAVGFQLECQQANFYYQNGEYYSKYTLGLLRHEFEQELKCGKLREYARYFSTNGKAYISFGVSEILRTAG